MDRAKKPWCLTWPALLAASGLLTGLLYAQVLGHGFLRWDDLGFYVENPHLHGFTADNLWWIATSSGDGIWKPLTWLSFMAGFRWLGPDPGLHLLVNPAIHAVNALLAGLLVSRLLALPTLQSLVLDRRLAGLLAAVLFAVHPVQVEAVAWLSGRKEVLCALFYLLAVLCWVRHLEGGAMARRWFLLAWLAQGLAILSKPMAVTVPAALLLVDLLARRDLSCWRLLLEKWPFALWSAFIVPVAIWGQQAAGALPDTGLVPLLVRYAQGVDSYSAYLAKVLFPANLLPYYPSLVTVDPWRVLAGTLVLVLLGGLAWRDYRAGRRLWLLAIGWYLLVFFPVAGWLQVGEHRVADRYAYLPAAALYAAMAVSLAYWAVARPRLAAATALAVVLGLMAVTYRQVGIWQDDRTLWEYTAARQQPAGLIYNNLGSARYADGDYAGAVAAYRTAVALQPSARHYRNLLLACQKAGDWHTFALYAQTAAVRFPEDPFLRLQPATVLLMRRDHAAAIAFFRALPPALAQDPQVAWGLAWAHAGLGQRQEALAALQRLLAADPQHAGGRALQQQLQQGADAR